MEKFYRMIVKGPKKIIVLFVGMALLCAVLSTQVGVNYDMKDYLPESTASTVSLERMEEEFDGGIPNARVMVKDVSIEKALEYKELLEACAGVTAVTWLDDVVNILEPLETMDTDTVETYYKDGAALFTITIPEEDVLTAVDEIRAVIGDDNCMTGDAVATAQATTGTTTEIRKIASFAVVFILLVLLLTTHSWIEPVIVLLGLGVAVLINSGTNLIFGEISFVTNAAGAILQLAVSLDYSVFLIHRFEECQLQADNEKEAMVAALGKSTSSILSSGLTTVIGFLALIFMRFQIGPDLGLALAKGVAISLVTVFVFMPNLILMTNSALKKTRHKDWMPRFKTFGHLVYRVMIPFVIVFCILVVPAYRASGRNTYYYGSAYIYGEGTKYGDDTAKIEEIFGKSDTWVVMVPNGDTARQSALSDALHAITGVKSILSYVDTVGAEIPEEYLDADTLSQLVSENYSRFVMTMDADTEGEESFSLVEAVRETVNEYYPDDYYLAGTCVSSYDLMDTITADTVKVNAVAIGAVFLVLLLTMKSLTLPVILVISIEAAIWINVGIPYLTGTTVFYIAYLIISSIQLGATVDYAILFTDRYLEHRASMGKKDAVIQTISSVAVSVLTSGSVLAVVGFLLGAISEHGILSELGNFLGIGNLLSLTVVFFVLPGFLYLFDGLIRHTTKGLHLL
ncbi:MAG: MMPL family transporter [Lachnospiraceae bacterium]|nr:MMPL family transporter [Lachnospiraceae bacterium]